MKVSCIESDMKLSSKCQVPFANLLFPISLGGIRWEQMELTKLWDDTGQLIILADMTGFSENDKVYITWGWRKCLSVTTKKIMAGSPREQSWAHRCKLLFQISLFMFEFWFGYLETKIFTCHYNSFCLFIAGSIYNPISLL